MIDKQQNYVVIFAIVVENIYKPGYFAKVNDFFQTIIQRGWLFASVDDGCHQHSLSRLSDRVHSLEANIKRLSGEGLNIYNNIIVARIQGEIDGYALHIVVLMEKLNDSEAFRITLEQYLFF